MKTTKVSYASDDHSRYAGAAYQDRPGRRSDGRIHEEVCEALSNDPYLDVSDIEIAVDEGVVTLKGKAASREVKRDAQTCIEHISGIRDIFNLITLYEFEDRGSEGLMKHQAHLE